MQIVSDVQVLLRNCSHSTKENSIVRSEEDLFDLLDRGLQILMSLHMDLYNIIIIINNLISYQMIIKLVTEL